MYQMGNNFSTFELIKSTNGQILLNVCCNRAMNVKEDTMMGCEGPYNWEVYISSKENSTDTRLSQSPHITFVNCQPYLLLTVWQPLNTLQIWIDTPVLTAVHTATHPSRWACIRVSSRSNTNVFRLTTTTGKAGDEVCLLVSQFVRT